MNDVFEFRGCDNLVYAKVITDTAEKFETGEVKSLAGLANVGASFEQSTEPHYYDNQAKINIKAVGAETRTFEISGLRNAVLAEITGMRIDTDTGAIIGGDYTNDYFAVGYRVSTTNDTHTYKWALKGTFEIPEESVATKNGGTDASGMSLNYSGVSTNHKFEDGRAASFVYLEDTTEDGTKLDMSTWFEKVQTPDTISTFKPSPSI